MTPMIDVTFLLIIFFLVSSHLAQQELQVDLELPAAASGDDLKDDDARRITVNLLADGTMLMSGDAVDEAELGRRLATERARDDKLEVRIRSDRTVDYGRVKPIMRECLRNDVWKVTFAVLRKTGAGG